MINKKLDEICYNIPTFFAERKMSEERGVGLLNNLSKFSNTEKTDLFNIDKHF